MPLKYIRVLTKATDDNPGVAPLIFDVVLDTETGRVALDDAIRLAVRDVVLEIDSVIRWTGNGYDQTFRVIELRDMVVRAK